MRASLLETYRELFVVSCTLWRPNLLSKNQGCLGFVIKIGPGLQCITGDVLWLPVPQLIIHVFRSIYKVSPSLQKKKKKHKPHSTQINKKQDEKGERENAKSVCSSKFVLGKPSDEKHEGGT